MSRAGLGMPMDDGDEDYAEHDESTLETGVESAHAYADGEARGMAFSTATDYLGGRWIGGEFYAQNQVDDDSEFNPLRQHQRTLTREDHLYGVFNQDHPSSSSYSAGVRTAKKTKQSSSARFDEILLAELGVLEQEGGEFSGSGGALSVSAVAGLGFESAGTLKPTAEEKSAAAAGADFSASTADASSSSSSSSSSSTSSSSTASDSYHSGSFTPAPSQLRRMREEKERERLRLQERKRTRAGEVSQTRDGAGAAAAIHGLGFRSMEQAEDGESSSSSSSLSSSSSSFAGYRPEHEMGGGAAGLGSLPAGFGSSGSRDPPGGIGASASSSTSSVSNKSSSRRRGEAPRASAGVAGSSTANAGRGVAAGSDPKPVASWEKYTKGVGSRLLQRMGWSGKGGLGPDGKGRAAPIEVKLRPKQLGIAFGGFVEETGEMRRARAKESGGADGKGEGGENELQRREAELQRKLEQTRWKKQQQDPSSADTDMAKKKEKKHQQTVVYKTASELLAEQESAKTQVIYDMTGPQSRVITSTSQLKAVASQSEALFDMPELTHNIRELISLQESEIRNNDRKLQHQQKQLKLLQQECADHETSIATDQDKLDTLTDILSILDRCAEKLASTTGDHLSLGELINIQELLLGKFPRAYRQLKLEEVCYGMIHGELKSAVEAWDPLTDPSHLVGEMAAWRLVIQTVADSPHHTFDRAMLDVMLPKFRRCIAGSWDVFQPSQVVSLLHHWNEVLSDGVYDMIMTQLIVPKLQRSLEHWNARNGDVPLHVWLLPWSRILDRSSFLSLSDTARLKLSSSLGTWQPSDETAKSSLVPWRGTWSKQQLQQLVSRCILPKLHLALQQMEVNPAQQDIRPVQWAMQWEDLASESQFVNLFETAFFPNWFEALCSWLSAHPDLKQVSEWYQLWKKMFSAQLLANERIRLQFNHALLLMKQALSGTQVEFKPPQLAQASSSIRSHSSLPSHVEPRSAAAHPIRPQQSFTFRDVVSRLAEKHNILFAPNTRRQHPSGVAVYNFGRVPVVILDNVVHRLENGDWIPTSLEELTRAEST